MNSSYDAVVVGEGMSLLSAGLTLVRNGARTLLIQLPKNELTTTPGTKPDPHLEHFTPYIEGLDLMVLLRELGLSPAELRALKPLNPPLQCIMPKRRFQLTLDDATFKHELQREFGDNLSDDAVEFSQTCHDRAIKTVHHMTMFTTLPPTGWREKFRNRQASARLSGLHKTRNFREEKPFWEILSRAFGLMVTNAVPTQPQHLGAAEHLISLARWGSFDGRAIYSLLKQNLSKKGADFLVKGQLQSISSRRRQLVNLKLANADFESIHFGTMILATHPHRLPPYLDGGAKWQRMIKWVEQQNIVYDRYVLPIQILKEGAPIGMSPRALLIQDPQAALFNHNLLLVDREMTDDGKTLLWVRFNVPHQQIISPELIQKIHNHLAEVIPFFHENLLPSPWPALSQGYVYGKGDPQKECQLFGASPTTPYKNLYLASAANLPELGFEGEILAGMKTAHMALVSRVKKGQDGLVLERNSISL